MRVCCDFQDSSAYVVIFVPEVCFWISASNFSGYQVFGAHTSNRKQYQSFFQILNFVRFFSFTKFSLILNVCSFNLVEYKAQCLCPLPTGKVLVLVLFPKPKNWTPGGYSMGLSAVVIPDILR